MIKGVKHVVQYHQLYYNFFTHLFITLYHSNQNPNMFLSFCLIKSSYFFIVSSL